MYHKKREEKRGVVGKILEMNDGYQESMRVFLLRNAVVRERLKVTGGSKRYEGEEMVVFD